MPGVRRGRDRKGRRALLWAAALVVLAQLAAGLLLDYVWPELRFPSAYHRLAGLRSRRRPPEVICLGSSRFGSDCPEEALNRGLGVPALACNLSVPAGDLVTDEFLLRQTLRQGLRPRLVVIEVAPEALNRRNDWLQNHVSRQLRWDDLPRYLVDVCRAGQLGRLIAARLWPLYVHRQALCDRVAGWLERPARDGRPENADGAEGSDVLRLGGEIDWQQMLARSSDGVSRSQQERTEEGLYGPRRCLRKYKVGGTATAALERLLQRCLDHGITAVLVGVPVSEPHRRLYTPAIEGRFRAYIDRVSRAYQCPFVDYRDRVPDALFHDNHHMMPEGGLYFGALLGHEVLAPLYRSRPQTP